MLIVKKFGGTSVRLLNNVLNIVFKEILLGNNVIVIVSALSGVTDALLSDFKFNLNCADEEVNGDLDGITREKNALLSCGEIASAALVASSLLSKGCRAMSLSAWQSGIFTDENRGNSNIAFIDRSNIQELLNNRIVPVIAGFQGINAKDFSINTLCRGGSDYTAVAIAHAFSAERCDIYTDVDGFYDSDPNKSFNSRHIEKIDYNHLLLSTLAGNKVVQYTASALSMQKNINLCIKSTISNQNRSSQICNFEDSFNKVFSICLNDCVKILKISPNKNFSLQEICYKCVSNNIYREKIIRFFFIDGALFFFIKDEENELSKFLKKNDINHDIFEDLNMISIISSNPDTIFDIHNIVLKESLNFSLNLNFFNCSQGFLSFFLKKEMSYEFANNVKKSLQKFLFISEEN